MVVSDPRAAKQKLWRHRGQPAWWAHSQSSNFQPVLNSKHMSNPTCFTQITHALKIKPCSAAELEWDQSVLPSLHRDHLKSCWVFFFFFSPFFLECIMWVAFQVCFLSDICLICCPLSLPCLQVCSHISASPSYRHLGFMWIPRTCWHSSKPSSIFVIFHPFKKEQLEKCGEVQTALAVRFLWQSIT